MELDLTKYEKLTKAAKAKLEEIKDDESEDSSSGASPQMAELRYRLVGLVYHDEKDLGRGRYYAYLRKQIKKAQAPKDEDDAKVDQGQEEEAKSTPDKKQPQQITGQSDGEQNRDGSKDTSSPDGDQKKVPPRDEAADAVKVHQWYAVGRSSCEPIPEEQAAKKQRSA